MAAGILSLPGTKHGPCKNECKHKDCAGTRKMAESICPRCEKAIGYETRFYKITGEITGTEYYHADCLEE